MDLNEAAQRIFKYHWVLILLMTIVGLAVPTLLAQSQEDTYVASSRIVMGAADARDGQEAAALADTALAVATSPGVLSAVLDAAGVDRTESEIAGNVQVDPVGASGVLQVSVTDRDPAVPAPIANALAVEIVEKREAAVLGETKALLEQTDEQIAALAQNVAAIQAEADAAAREEALARARGESPGNSLQAISLRHSQAVSQLNRVQGQRSDLAKELAQAIRPEVIDASATEGTRVDTGLSSRVAIGGLLGLILGIALAATWEAWRPTLGPSALARHLGVPLLGHLKRLPQGPGQLTDSWLASYVSLAADGAGVRSFELVPVGPGVDVTGLARSLAADTDAETPRRGGREIVPLTLDGPHDGKLPSTSTQPGTGVIVVAPMKVKGAWLDLLERHVQLTRQPVIGVISYARRATIDDDDETEYIPAAQRPRTVAQDPAPTVAVNS